MPQVADKTRRAAYKGSGFLQQCRLAAANVGTLQNLKAGLGGWPQFRLEFLGPYLARRLDQKEAGARFGSGGSLGKESGRRGHLVHHGEGEGEIHLAGKAGDAKGIR